MVPIKTDALVRYNVRNCERLTESNIIYKSYKIYVMF